MSFVELFDDIRAFTRDELIPGEAALTETGEVPPTLVDRMSELGLFGISIPSEYGGLGLSMEEQALLTMEFTQASCVYRSRFSTTVGLCSQVILDYGTAEQRSQYLPPMALGECVGAFALTEPGAGSDASSLSTRATRSGERWVLNGEKRYITNAGWADVFLFVARCEDERRQGVGVFVVDAKADGIRVEVAHRMNGHEAGPVGQVFLRNVSASDEALIGNKVASDLKPALRGINHARLHVAATGVGQSIRLLSEATRHAQSRSQFSQALADMPVIQGRLGRMFSEVAACRALVLESARRFDTGEIPVHMISAVKLRSTETAFRVADACLQICGGEGIVGDSPVPRLWRDVRALRIYEGASEVHERNLGRFVKRQIASGQELFPSDL